jgi:hypothetical protein
MNIEGIWILFFFMLNHFLVVIFCIAIKMTFQKAAPQQLKHNSYWAGGNFLTLFLSVHFRGLYGHQQKNICFRTGKKRL